MQPANSADFPPVAVLFEREEIAELFAGILRARGVPTRIIQRDDTLIPSMRLITEPRLFPALPGWSPHRCLVVGEPGQLSGIDAHHLTQPLTEDKVEQAIKALLSS